MLTILYELGEVHETQTLLLFISFAPQAEHEESTFILEFGYAQQILVLTILYSVGFAHVEHALFTLIWLSPQARQFPFTMIELGWGQQVLVFTILYEAPQEVQTLLLFISLLPHAVQDKSASIFEFGYEQQMLLFIIL